MISLARRKHRLTQEQFAHLLGVSFSSINAWETGKRVPQKRMQELILAVTQKDKLPNFQERLADKMHFELNESTGGLIRSDAGFVSSVLDYNGRRSQLDFTHSIGRWYGCLPSFLVRDLVRFLATDFQVSGPALINFCGSGTVALEFALSGIPCCAVDLNPVALLLTYIKTRPLKIPDDATLGKVVDEVVVGCHDKQRSNKQDVWKFPVSAKNLLVYPNKWIDKATQGVFLSIISSINRIKDETLQSILSVALVDIAVDFCHIDKRCTNHYVYRHREFSLHDLLSQFAEETLRIAEACRSLQGLRSYSVPEVRWGDASALDFEAGFFDTIFSHPPYGNSINYYSISRVGLSIVETYEQQRKLWAVPLVGELLNTVQGHDLSSGTRKKFAKLISTWIGECHRVLRKEGLLLVVIGDNRANGQLFHPHTMVIDEAENHGMVLRELFVWVTENKSGMHIRRKGHHIDHNYILILQKK